MGPLYQTGRRLPFGRPLTLYIKEKEGKIPKKYDWLLNPNVNLMMRFLSCVDVSLPIAAAEAAYERIGYGEFQLSIKTPGKMFCITLPRECSMMRTLRFHQHEFVANCSRQNATSSQRAILIGHFPTLRLFFQALGKRIKLKPGGTRQIFVYGFLFIPYVMLSDIRWT